ncbi:MAG: hypothetical protein O3B16_04280, partial [Chloroflexi bacterium]|nr:hypothetical protein [Chloroflexota bacterium]
RGASHPWNKTRVRFLQNHPQLLAEIIEEAGLLPAPTRSRHAAAPAAARRRAAKPKLSQSLN